MGLRIRKRIKICKGLYINVSKSGISTSAKIGNVTLNSRGRVTASIPGTGISYTSKIGNAKTARSRKLNTKYITEPNSKRSAMKILDSKLDGYNKGFNKKLLIAIGIFLLVCFTPAWPLGLVTAFLLSLWFTIDLIVRIIKFNLENKKSSLPELPPNH